VECITQNPVPDFPVVDIMITHGPPYGVCDLTYDRVHVGCDHLLRAASRARPRIHAFGHIHEGWGAEKVTWKANTLSQGTANTFLLRKQRGEKALLDLVQGHEAVRFDELEGQHAPVCFVDASNGGPSPLQYGEETLMVNASIMTIFYKPKQRPWLVDIDLPLSGGAPPL
jgi:hypothetical protein